jgi:EmrB/QacA subfamily drug resistance transporter
MTSSTTHPGHATEVKRGTSRRWWILALAAVAQLMVVLDMTVVNVALPSAQSALHFSNADRQWVVTAYSLAFGSTLLLGGKIGDLFGRRWTLVGSAIAFAAASAVGGAATSFAMLVGARAIQGVSGALLAPAALSLLTTTFTEPSERNKALGIYGAIGGSGGAIGLLLGGVLTQLLDWRWVMYVNLIIAAVTVIGALTLLRTEARTEKPRLDLPGTATVSGGLFAIVFGLSHAETTSFTDPVTLAFLAGGTALLALFAWIESRVSEPLLPLRILTDRTRAASLISILISAASMFGVFLFLTYYLQQNLGYDPIDSGLAFLPMTLVLIVTATLASTKLQPRLGPAVLVGAGMALSALGMLYLTRLGVHASYATDILPTLLAMGIGLGLVFPTAMNAGTRGVAAKDAGVASATVNTSQQVGGSIGTALFSTIAASATTNYLAGAHTLAAATIHGYTTAFGASAVLFAAGAILAPILFGRRRSKPAERAAGEPALGFH